MSSDIGNLSTGRPISTTPKAPSPLSVQQQPAPKPQIQPPAPTTAPPIIVPEGAGSGGLKKGAIFGIVIVAVLAIGAYLLLSGSDDNEQVVVNSKAPSATPSATLAIKSLVTYFRLATNSVELKADESARKDFSDKLSTSTPSAKQALRMPILGPYSASLSTFIEGLGISLAPDFKSSLATDWAVLSFGQTEQFDDQGQKITSSATEPRLIMISELKDVSGANKAMQTWEANGLASSLAGTMGFNLAKSSLPTFSSGTYRQIPIRYQNYPYANRSLDYAVLLASNGRNYLLITNSREAMFFAIDQLLQ